MLNHFCWDCKSNTGHELCGEASGRFANSIGDNYRIFAAFRCCVCNAQSIGVAVVGDSEVRRAGGIAGWAEQAGAAGPSTDRRFSWFPSAQSTKSYPDVPPHIASAATEAYECAAQNHNRAAVLLARAVIEATAKDKGITSGNLYEKIEKLHKLGHIREHVKLAAHAVRVLGNDMAHGDFVEPISEEHTRLVIALMDEILLEVFQSIAQIRRAQEAVGARKNNDSQK